MSFFKNPQFEHLKSMTNVIMSPKCYVHADTRGIILRFMVDDEIAPPILVDEQLAAQLHDMIGQFLEAKKQERSHEV